MENRPNGQRPLILYIDDSPESEALQKALRQLGRSFRIVYASSDVRVTPAIEGPFGLIQGYHNICRYLLPRSECSLWASTVSG